MERRDHLPMLDGVRFACALAVLVYHALAVFPLAASSVTHDFDPALLLPDGLAGVAWWGWIGVELFFVVWGYVIAASAGNLGPTRFARRRALRLLPAAWVCATLIALVLLLGSTVPTPTIARRWATSMLLFPLGEPIDEIYWTLGVEVAFYGLVAALLREGVDNRGRIERLGLTLALASLAFWTAEFTGALTVVPGATPLRLLLLPHGGFFAVGIALQSLAQGRRGRTTRLALVAGLGAGAGEIVALTATMRGVPAFDASPIVPLAIFAAGVVAIALAPRFGRDRRYTGIAMLGAMTYPLYLLNQRFMAAALHGLVHAGVPAPLAIAAAMTIVLGLAWFIAIEVEPRLRAWLALRLSARRGPAPDIVRSAFPPAG